MPFSCRHLRRFEEFTGVRLVEGFCQAGPQVEECSTPKTMQFPWQRAACPRAVDRRQFSFLFHLSVVKSEVLLLLNPKSVTCKMRINYLPGTPDQTL